MSEEIEAWAVRLAKAVTPNEAVLASDFAAAFVAGGEDRADLFRTSGALPGAFDTAGVLAVFPFVLSAATAAGPAIEAFLSSGVTSVPGMVKDVIELWDRYRRREVAQAKEIPLGSEPPYQALDRMFDVIEAELGRAGMEPDQRDLLTYRIVRHLLDDVDGTREFVDAAAKAPGR